MTVPFSLRHEQAGDAAAIWEVVTAAFGQEDEARLVQALREADAALVSLVGVLDGRIVGHILFSPVTIQGISSLGPFAGLAPVSVLPEFQGQGIGDALCRHGLEACRSLGCRGCVVLGHAEYYPRFGFVPADQFGLRCEYDCPPENFMAMAMASDGLASAEGLVKYHPAFGAL